ncbi:MAG: heme exporter protein CcmD [Pseudomonadota bacterium]
MISGDPYLPYVLISYGSTAVILGLLLWATLAANARARQALEDRR